LTSFLEIYNLQETLKNDSRLINKPTNQIYSLYNSYLQYAVGLFYPYCYKDLLTNSQEFSQIEYYFESDGTDNNFLLQSPSIPLTNGQFYVGYKTSENSVYTEVQSSDYTYNSATNVLTIALDTFFKGTCVYVSSYIVGNFPVELNLTEQNILAEAMLIPYLKEHQNRNTLLTQMIYGGSTKIYSQSSHLDSVHKTVREQVDDVMDMIIKYTYILSPNKLKDLGARS